MKKKEMITRRDFIKTSAMAGTAIILAGSSYVAGEKASNNKNRYVILALIIFTLFLMIGEINV